MSLTYNASLPYFLITPTGDNQGETYYATQSAMEAAVQARVAEFEDDGLDASIPDIVGGLITQSGGVNTYQMIPVDLVTTWEMTDDTAASIIANSDGDTYGTQRLDFTYIQPATLPTTRLTLAAATYGNGCEFKMTTFSGANGLEAARLSYKLRLADLFEFVKGGKLPGLYGGDGYSIATIPDGTDGFSVRLHWNLEGYLSAYAYLPYDNNVTYGKHFFLQKFFLRPGQWHDLELELILNTPGVADGVMRLYADDELVGEELTVHYRDIAGLQINGFLFSSYFGGGDASYNSAKEEWLDFTDIKITYTGTFETVTQVPATTTLPANVNTYAELEQHANYDIWQAANDSWRFFYSPYVATPTIRMKLPANVITTNGGGEARPVWYPGNGLESATMTYYVRFQEGFDFSLGGKIPGMYGGVGNSGGLIPDGTDGWSLRNMWNSGGSVTVYAYLPYRHNVTYGYHFFLGVFSFTPGQWHKVVQQAVMNTPTIGDGIIRLWVDDNLVGEQTDIIFRDVSGLGVRGPFMSVFRGGNTLSYASPNEYFVDYHGLKIVAG